MSKFMPTAPRAQKTLADLIMQKIEAKNAMDSGIMATSAQGKSTSLASEMHINLMLTALRPGC
jgi:hypothetical protein